MSEKDHSGEPYNKIAHVSNSRIVCQEPMSEKIILVNHRTKLLMLATVVMCVRSQ